jgi:inositol transport system substrate-binding protein
MLCAAKRPHKSATVTQGVQGIVLIPNDVNALASAANKVLAAKIPIATVDRNVAGTTEPIAHVGADNWLAALRWLSM